MENKIPYLRTKDFSTMRRLIAAGAVLQQIEWDYTGKIGTAFFEDEDQCNKIIDKHRRGKLRLNSRDFDRADGEIKKELHSNK